MKKKLALILTVALLCLAFALALCACNKGDGDLQYRVRYADKPLDSLEDDENFEDFFFDKNGTGVYRYRNLEYGNDYSLYFKWHFADKDKSTVICYYDSIDGTPGNYPPESDWCTVLMVSKNTLMRSTAYGYTLYVNENYFKEIPNYNNK